MGEPTGSGTKTKTETETTESTSVSAEKTTAPAAPPLPVPPPVVQPGPVEPEQPKPLPWQQRYIWIAWVLSISALPTAVIGNCAQRESVEVSKKQYELAKAHFDQENERREAAERVRLALADAGPDVSVKVLGFKPNVDRFKDGGSDLRFSVYLEVTNSGDRDELISGGAIGLGYQRDAGPQLFMYANNKVLGLSDRVVGHTTVPIRFESETIQSTDFWSPNAQVGPNSAQLHAWLFVKGTRGIGVTHMTTLMVHPSGYVAGQLTWPSVEFSIVPPPSMRDRWLGFHYPNEW